MEKIRYIHAADLHLDAAFRGLSRSVAAVDDIPRDAGFAALNRLVLLCEKEKPDFLVLAGDLYNSEDQGITAQMRLAAAFQKLARLGIRVFAAHGAHDPAPSRIKSIHWPENATFFGTEPQKFYLEKNGAPCAIIHGVSHAGARESRNLARLFQRAPDTGLFQLGVLYCAAAGGDDSLTSHLFDDLRASGLDAWALGHAHEKNILCQKPFIACSGAIQGLDIAETGPRGCYLVEVEKAGGQWSFQCDFHALNSVQWEKLVVNIAKSESVSEIENRLVAELEKLRASLPPSLAGAIARLELEGRTSLNLALRKEETINSLLEMLANFARGRPRLWIKDIITRAEPLTDFTENPEREDLPGEIAKIGKSLLENEPECEKFMADNLAELYNYPGMSGILQPLSPALARELLLDARYICQDALED